MSRDSKLRNRIKYCLPDRIAHQIIFFKNYHRFINYKHPVLMDEKLLILKEQYANQNNIKQLIDKYRVREFIINNHHGDILNELYQVCDSSKEISWESLPTKYVLKCNHGSGYNIIVQDSNIINRVEISEQLDAWLKEDYAVVSGEKQYTGIVPKIIIERYIETKDGHFPPDYKFFVSYGKVIGCLLITNRDSEEKRIFVDCDFRDLGFINENLTNYLDYKPQSWDQLLSIAAELGKDFPFVRIDLYDNDGKVIFGEFTFTPHGCIHRHISDEGQRYIGDLIKF